MFKRYINLTLIPAFFVTILFVSACTKKERQLEPFSDFSSTEEEVIEITKTDEEKPKKENLKADLNFIKKFNIGYLAFNVADIYFEAKPIEATSEYVKYKTRAYSRTNGMVDYFMGWLSHTVGYTKVYKNKVVPESFRTKVKHKKKTREIELVYDKSGKNYKTDKVTPPDNRLKRPAVSKKDKFGSFDPLSAFYEARRQVKSAFDGDNFNSKGFYTFTVPVYDGRRRTDFLFTLEEKPVDDGHLRLAIRLKPVAGHTNKELNKDEGSTGAFLTILLDPTSYIPTKIIGKHPLGTASADFVSNCNKTFEDCIK